MWIMWAMIAFAVAMVVGPVMMMRPSPGMARLAETRTYASQKGLSVRLRSPSEKKKKDERGAIYTLQLNEGLRKAQKDLDDWRLYRHSRAHEIHFQDHWDWEGKGRAPQNCEAFLKAQLESLPESISLIEFSAAGVGLLWDERLVGRDVNEAVDELAQQMAEFLSGYETAISGS